MNKTRIIINVVLISALLSCKPLGRMSIKINGEFIKPQNETAASIREYCHDKNVDYDKSYVIRSEELYTSFLSKYKHIPGVFIFDKNKYLITTDIKTDCPWTMMNLLKDTITKTKLLLDSSMYHDIMLHYMLIDDRTKKKEADYYILSTWGKFIPKLTKALFDNINKQKEEKKLNVCYILLNVDLQDSWVSKK